MFFKFDATIVAYFIACLGFLMPARIEAQLPQCLLDKIQDYPRDSFVNNGRIKGDTLAKAADFAKCMESLVNGTIL